MSSTVFAGRHGQFVVDRERSVQQVRVQVPTVRNGIPNTHRVRGCKQSRYKRNVADDVRPDPDVGLQIVPVHVVIRCPAPPRESGQARAWHHVICEYCAFHVPSAPSAASLEERKTERAKRIASEKFRYSRLLVMHNQIQYFARLCCTRGVMQWIQS